jgi:tetratricopeptide (TPR) repeat protein
LTGRPPFVGGSMLETLRLVMETTPAAPRQLQPQVPRAIETICLKCLDHDPRRRYSSADALAEDLRRFLAGVPILAIRTGPTRRLWSWCRRKPVVAGLAGALLLSVVGGFALVTWQWRRADQQRQTAEHGWTEADRQRREAQRQSDQADMQRASAAASLRHAHDAVHTYFTLVSDSTLLDTPGMQPLRSQLLQSALDHYVRFQKNGGDSPALRVEIAASYFRVAQLHHLNDRNDESIVAIARGVQLAQELLRDPPQDAGFPQRLAGLLTGSGRRLHRYTKPPKDARAAGETLLAAIQLWEEIARRYPHIPECRVDIATLCCLFGEMLYENRQHAEAEKWLSRATDLWPALLAERPAASEWHAEYGRATLALGGTLRALGNNKAAEDAFLQAIALFTRLADGQAKAPHHRSLLATATYHLGLFYNATSRRSEAHARFDESANLFAGLVSEYPHISSAREGAASIHISTAELLAKRGDAAQARDALTKAVSLLEQLKAEYPQKAAYRGRLNNARARLEKLP